MFRVLCLALLLCSEIFVPIVFSSNAEAQELKELIRRNRDMEDRDPVLFDHFDWPKYDWQEQELNFSQIFSGRSGARLPLIWLGEPGEGYGAGTIISKASSQHIRVERVLAQSSLRGGEDFLLTVLVPHPKSVQIAELRVVADFKRALPKPEEVKIYRPLTVHGVDGMLFNRRGGGYCYISLKLPRSSVLSLYGLCRTEPLMMELLERLNIPRLLEKFNS